MKLCEHENCSDTAYYTNTFGKPMFCKTHKKDKMKTRYAICICGLAKPCFGFSQDIRPSCCFKCKKTEMIDLIHKKCVCGKTRPSYGLESDDNIICCKDCKNDDMIYLINRKKCICGKYPSFGLNTDKTATCCFECKTPEMINITSKKCKCEKTLGPCFGLKTDKTATCCSDCKTDEMIDLTHKKCICGKFIASFGLETDKKKICCSECKTDEMINLIHKKCVCGKSRPLFGLKNDKFATYCAKCKTDDMIDLVTKKCSCGTTPVFGLPNNVPTCCSKCKNDNMIDLKNKKCQCGKASPCFGFKNDKISICCAQCKTEEMINIRDARCKATDQNGKEYCTTLGNKKYKGYCTHCFAHLFPLDPLTFQIRCKTKEIAVRDFINSVFEGFHHDKPLWIGGCNCLHRRRIDHRKLIGNTLLCVGTDENQHKYYDKLDEKNRYDDLMMVHGGKIIYIRFNPDKYKENGVNKNPTIATRLKALSKVIDEQIRRVENGENTELLEIIKMYYDN